MRFVNIVFYATGVLTWYALLVLIIARLLHGPARLPRQDDKAAEEEQRHRDNAIWN